MSDRLDAEQVVADAIETAGDDDLGPPTWAEGLERVVDGLRTEAGLHELGVEIARAELVGYLANRARIRAWRREHPEVADHAITDPIVIVGQPRTGTTILVDLLAQDPGLRAPLSWEVDRPVPPPTTDTYDTDPRIEQAQAEYDAVESLMPGFTNHHPIGAQRVQECVRITAGDFRSMIFNTQYRVPTYRTWLFEQADVASAYQWHHTVLQHLQSRHRGDRWLLKSPAHLWHLPALLAEYPDAFIVQTHRDPLKVIASVSALAVHLRGLASDRVDPHDVAADLADDILLGLDRCLADRAAGRVSDSRVVDVHFDRFVADPLGTIRGIYRRLDRELTDEVVASMRSFLDDNPGDQGGLRYRFSDTGLDPHWLRERVQAYQDRFEVPSERLR